MAWGRERRKFHSRGKARSRRCFTAVKSPMSKGSMPAALHMSQSRPLLRQSTYCSTFSSCLSSHSGRKSSYQSSQLPSSTWVFPRRASSIRIRSMRRLSVPFSRKSPSMMSSSLSEKPALRSTPSK